MQLHRLATTYAAKTDEELLQLAADPDQLTPESLTILLGELARRRIAVPDTSQHNDKPVQSDRQWDGGDISNENEVGNVADFVADTLRLYHQHLNLFVKLTAPAVLVGYFAVMATGHEIREISRHVPHGFMQLFMEIAFLRVAGFLASWLAFSFSYAAICSAVDQTAKGSSQSALDCFMAVRNRLSAFFRLSLLLFFVVSVVEGATIFAGSGFFWVLHRSHVQPSSLSIWIFSYVTIFLCLLPVTRLALAMPAVILDNCRIGQALFRSDELTQGKWLILAALLSKSVIGSYVAGMVPFWIRAWIWSYVQLPSFIAVMASVAAVTVVEPAMFIGFALLYVRMKASCSAFSFAPLQLGAQRLEEI